MSKTADTKPVLHQRVKQAIVAALLTLSLGLGIATTLQSIKPPHTPIIKGVASIKSAVSLATVSYCYKDPGKGIVCVKK